MDNPGSVSLGDINLTTAQTQVGTPVTGLAGMLGVTLLAFFAYGSNGTTCRVYFQTSFDGGQTWCDIACVLFTTASGALVVNISALDSSTIWTAQTDGALTDNGIFGSGGPLGDQLRVKVVSTGTYAGSTLASLWAVAR